MAPRYVFSDDDREFVFTISQGAGIGAENIASALTTRHQQELQSKGISKITATEVSQLLERYRAERVGKCWTDRYREDEEYESNFRSQWTAYGLLIWKGHELPKDSVSEFTQRWDDVGKANIHFQEFMHRTFASRDQYWRTTDPSDQSEQEQERPVPKEGLINREERLGTKEKGLMIRERELAYQERELTYQERELAYQERQLPYNERKWAHQHKEQAF
ncbi:MAG: hypothetical protein LQ342_007826 [Letrouitia transgressa]|nr:MAG: hypothetical protein LQ342_007826 [Letrouitia transgressa]